MADKDSLTLPILDVPGGLVVAPEDYEPGVPGLRFYTGRIPVLYDVDDVRALVDALEDWLAGVKPAAEATRAP